MLEGAVLNHRDCVSSFYKFLPEAYLKLSKASFIPDRLDEKLLFIFLKVKFLPSPPAESYLISQRRLEFLITTVTIPDVELCELFKRKMMRVFVVYKELQKNDERSARARCICI